jgi:hypothetical protein
MRFSDYGACLHMSRFAAELFTHDAISCVPCVVPQVERRCICSDLILFYLSPIQHTIRLYFGDDAWFLSRTLFYPFFSKFLGVFPFAH